MAPFEVDLKFQDSRFFGSFRRWNHYGNFLRFRFPIDLEFDTIGDSQGNLGLARHGYFITSTFRFIMSNSKIRGTVHVIEETKSFGQKGFRKRLVVLEQQNGRFANYIPVEFTNDACDAVDGMKLGDEVDVTYRLSGRKWQKDPNSEVKYFLSAEAMGFHRVGEGNGGMGEDDLNDAFSQAAADDGADAPF